MGNQSPYLIFALSSVLFAPPALSLQRSRILTIRTKTGSRLYDSPSLLPTPEASIEVLSKMLAAGGGFVNLVTKGGKAKEQFLELFSRELSETIPSFSLSLTADKRPYIQRTDLERSLVKFRDRKSTKGEIYLVVVGPKGAGKSALVAHVFEGRPGTVVVDINQNSSPQSIVADILLSCSVRVGDKELSTKQLREPLVKAMAKKGSPVTIILEMNRGNGDLSTLGAVRSATKDLAQHANVIVVLSEANGALEFDCNREPRQRVIWVDGFTNEEALSYAKENDIPLSEDDLQRFFDEVGTLPVQIDKLHDCFVDEGMSLEDIICAEVKRARVALVAFPFKKILIALKKSPDGVNVEDFDGVEERGVLLCSPTHVARYMEDNALKYHLPSSEYRLMTNAHKTALRSYEPPQITNATIL